MNDWIGEGRTTEDAVARGLARLKLRLDQVEVQELGERQSGLLSMFGFRRVKVRLVEIPRKGARFDRRLDDERGDRRHEHRDERGGRASGRRDEPRTRRESPGPQKSERRDARRADGRGKNRPPREERRPDREPREARKPAPPPRPPERRDAPAAPRPAVAPEVLLGQWKDLFGWDDLTWETKSEEGRVAFLLQTSRAARIAGGGARGLEALEYLFNLVSSGGDREKPWVAFRLEGFPTAEEGRLTDKALFAAFQVRRTGKPFRMDPMPPAQRRLIHQALANHPDVATASEGEGANRRVVVVPRGGAAPDAAGAGENPTPPIP
ncbi:MAG: Jag N-terminal domain-containing protein [Elusimicrobia bacterium]|nr:Jag N-terminal domain-containing protein [Elusimicrobiota bacterium]MBK8651221.1 Jag N-terminal domain-containing protein [Elusimicrobiota bacterium]